MGFSDILQGIGNVATATGAGLQGQNVQAILQAQQQQRDQAELQQLLKQQAAEIKIQPKKYYEIMRDFHIQKGNLPASMQATQALAQFRQAEKGKKLETAGMAIETKRKALSKLTPGSDMYRAAEQAHDADINTNLAQSGAGGIGHLMKKVQTQEKMRFEEQEAVKEAEEKQKKDLHFLLGMQAKSQGNELLAGEHLLKAGASMNEILKNTGKRSIEKEEFARSLASQGISVPTHTMHQLFEMKQLTQWKQKEDLKKQTKSALQAEKSAQEYFGGGDKVERRHTREALSNVKLALKQLERASLMVNNKSTGMLGMVTDTFSNAKANIEASLGQEVNEEQYNTEFSQLKAALGNIAYTLAQAEQGNRISDKDRDAFERIVGKPDTWTSPMKLRRSIKQVSDMFNIKVDHYTNTLHGEGGKPTKKAGGKNKQQTKIKGKTQTELSAIADKRVQELMGQGMDGMAAIKQAIEELRKQYGE